jgi:hypothetical protein
MVVVTLRFSRCAPPTWREKWQNKNPLDMSLWICRLTHSPFSHVDLLLGDGNLLGSSDSPHAPVVYGNPRGVAVRPVNYERYAVRRDVSVWTTPARKDRFEEFCRAQVGKPFDSAALKASTFLSPHFENRDWRKADKWFCAELMAHATEIAPLLDWAIPGIKNRVTPADLILLLAPLFDFNECKEPIPGLQLDPGEV